MLMARVLRLCIARYQGCLQLDLMIVRVGQRGMDLGQCQVRILLDDLRCTLAMGYVIRDNVNDPMTSLVNARHPTRIHGNVWIDHGFTHNTVA
jgi:hypothetical protein